jgi:hypothetical protein
MKLTSEDKKLVTAMLRIMRHVAEQRGEEREREWIAYIIEWWRFLPAEPPAKNKPLKPIPPLLPFPKSHQRRIMREYHALQNPPPPHEDVEG